MAASSSVLNVQLRDELQITAGQIRFDPPVDPLVHFGAKVVLPVARFACKRKFHLFFFKPSSVPFREQGLGGSRKLDLENET